MYLQKSMPLLLRSADAFFSACMWHVWEHLGTYPAVVISWVPFTCAVTCGGDMWAHVPCAENMWRGMCGGHVAGHVAGRVAGRVTGYVAGHVAGRAAGHVAGHVGAVAAVVGVTPALPVGPRAGRPAQRQKRRPPHRTRP